MSHGRLLTRSRTVRWNSGTDKCNSCKDKIETLLHTFRDCPSANSFWNNLIGPLLPPDFFTVQDQAVWLKNNLLHLNDNLPDWRDFFFSGCWLLWLWRNKEIHDPDFKRLDNPTVEVHNLLNDIKLPLSNPLACSPSPTVDISAPPWICPPPSWCKLNVDGAVSLGKTACGGLICDHQGIWLGGFKSFLGCCSPFLAELWAIYIGLEFAWSYGFKNLIVESDSSQAIRSLTSTGNAARELHLVVRIRAVTDRPWNIQFTHTLRGNNLCADRLAKEALSCPLGLVTPASLDLNLLKLISSDLEGSSPHPGTAAPD